MIKQLLTLEKTSVGSLAHHHYTNPNGSLFGGLVVGQAFLAVSHEIDITARSLHSLHAYFISRGDALSPVEYAVNTVREGRNFSAMNVVATQNDKDIFAAAMSFQKPEDNGVNHDFISTEVTPPSIDDIARMAQYLEAAKTDPTYRFFSRHRNDFFDIVTTQDNPMMLYKDGSARSEFWIKTSEKLADDALAQQQACLLIASDMGILFSTIAPYQVDIKNTQFTSVDHSVWLHDPHINMSEWHLIRANSVWAANSRSLVKAEIYNQSGKLVASIAQEGLVRTQLLT